MSIHDAAIRTCEDYILLIEKITRCLTTANLLVYFARTVISVMGQSTNCGDRDITITGGLGFSVFRAHDIGRGAPAKT
jgi:hypothetical protein